MLIIGKHLLLSWLAKILNLGERFVEHLVDDFDCYGPQENHAKDHNEKYQNLGGVFGQRADLDCDQERINTKGKRDDHKVDLNHRVSYHSRKELVVYHKEVEVRHEHDQSQAVKSQEVGAARARNIVDEVETQICLGLR